MRDEGRELTVFDRSIAIDYLPVLLAEAACDSDRN
jgi:hypothetical protein